MVATTASNPKTYEDYLQTPDDGQRYELIDGEIVVSPSPSYRHQYLAFELASLLRDFIRPRRLGKIVMAPMDVRLTRDLVVQPDILFIRKGSKTGIPIEGRIAGTPDLVVEILSDSTAVRDLNQKRAIYEASGVPEYWIVDPKAEKITVLALEHGTYVELPPTGGALTSRLFPALTFAIAMFFADQL